MPTLTQRAQGLLMGKALGDTLGAALEGMSAEQIRRTPGLLEGLASSPPSGFYTDDTQLALVLAETLIQTETFSPDFFVALCVRMARADSSRAFGAFRGTGANFRATVARWEAGIPWNRSGSNTAGNGAAMRVAPLGFFYATDPEHLIRAACESAICTHLNPTGVLAAVSVAQAVALCSTRNSGDFRGAALAAELVAGGWRAQAILEGEYRPYLMVPPDEADPWLGGLALLDGLLELEDEALAAAVYAHAAPHAAFTLQGAGDAFAPASVLLALALALKHAHAPVEALRRVIACGGDTDTTAAICGAILGALHGVEGWPLEWRMALACAPRIAAIGAQLALVAQGQPPSESLPDLVTSELALTRQMDAASGRP